MDATMALTHPPERASLQIAPQLGHGRFFHLDPTDIQARFTAIVQALWPQP